jgi:5-methylcytosine-specific restriction endonuclease McrA
LERDDYLCQACLTNKAEEIHHLTYENIYDEPLYQLIAVCKRCHDKIEAKKQNK